MKGKVCSKCNNCRLKRFYVRFYYEGYSFKNSITGDLTNKGKFNPLGWICDNCGNIVLDDNYKTWSMSRNLEAKEKQNLEQKIELMEAIQKQYRKLISYKRQIRHNNKFDKMLDRKLLLRRFWNVRSEIQTRAWLKGLHEGHKQADKYWKEQIEKSKLTDEQILKKAKLIENQKLTGFKL